MKFRMRLFQKRGWWHVELKRNRSRSLHTKDEKEAMRIFRELEREYLRGRLIQLDDVSRLTLTEFQRLYLKHREDLKDISSETIKKDSLSLKLLVDVIGKSILVRSISKLKFEEFKTVCLARNTSKITINGYLRHLKTAFRWAVAEGYLSKSPEIIMYKRLRQGQQMLNRILEPDEIDRLLSKSYEERGVEFGNYCNVLLWTGGRRREALNLEWQKIDLKNNRITLNGKTGTRTIPLLEPVRKILKPIKKDIGRVFPEWHPDTVSHWFQKAATDAGIEGHRLHDLRHTCATYMLKNKIPLDVVQRIMGHSQISTTQIYAKVLDDILQSEMQKLKFD